MIERANKRTFLPEIRPDNREAFYNCQEINYRGRRIRLRGIDHLCFRHKHLENRIPHDWQENVADDISKSSLVFVEYFPPELKQTLFWWPLDKEVPATLRGYQEWFKDWFELGIVPLFGEVAKIAQEQRRIIAVADIINKELACLYYLGVQGILTAFTGGAVPLSNHQKFSPDSSEFDPLSISHKESHWLNLDHVKRIYTAKAIMREAERHEEGSIITYVAPPAHTVRVKHFMEEGLTAENQRQAKIAKTIFPGLDFDIRLWKPSYSPKDGSFDS